MRVLYLNPTVAIGGAERSLLELVAGLDRAAVTPFAACIADGPLPRALREAGAEVRYVPFPAFALKVGRNSLASALILPLAAAAIVPHVFRIAALVRRERILIVHTNGLKSHVVGALATVLAGRRLVWHVRDVLRPGLTRRLYGLLARLTVDRLVANSRAVAATFPGMPPGRLRVVYNGLDTSRYAPGPRDPAGRAALGAAEGDFLVGAVGALAPLKGHLHLIRAMPRILERCPRARAVIVGEEMYLTIGHRGWRDVLEAEARRLGVADRVVLAGRRDDPIAVMRELDVLVHASIYPESFGRVLVEAMACGVPVIATALGGPTEILVSPDQGILIPPEDPGAIAGAVIRLHDDAAMRRRLGREGRARVVDAFSVDRYVREVEDLYRDIAA